MEGMNKDTGLQVGKFVFSNIKIERWMDTKSNNVEYHFERKLLSITLINPREALLRFEFFIEVDPIGKISFQGECILFSPTIKSIVMILKANQDSQLRRNNQQLITTLNKLLLARCFEEAKKIGEQEGIIFHGYETMLNQLGVENISYKKGENPFLYLQDDKLVLKKEKNIKNFAGFKDFKFRNEKISLGINAGNHVEDAQFDVNSRLIKPKILSQKKLRIQYKFRMKISPDVAELEFEGQFIMDSFVNDVGYLLKHQKKKLDEVLQGTILKEGIKHSSDIAKKNGVNFSPGTVLKKIISKK